MAKSYFAILGVSSNASPEEVRSAYRRLVKLFHPDHFEGGSDSFREIQEAYSVLGDAQRRDRYERSLENVRSIRSPRAAYHKAPEPLVPADGSVELGNISHLTSFSSFTPSYDEVFDRLWRHFSDMTWPESGRIQELTLEVPLTREQALRGGNTRVMAPARAVCPVCRGTGGIGYYECIRCAGEGAISGELPVSISFPARLTSDHVVTLPLDQFGKRNLRLTVRFRIVDVYSKKNCSGKAK